MASLCFAQLIPESLRRDHAGLIQRFLVVPIAGSTDRERCALAWRRGLRFCDPTSDVLGLRRSPDVALARGLSVPVERFLEVLLNAVAVLVEAANDVLGGRVAILTFHSGEDRRVKKAFQGGYRSGVYSDIANEVIRSTKEETFSNRRAAAAKLRWAVRATATD